MVNNTKVSIIIINYNYGLYLEEAINSSLSQKYENLEVIVVDIDLCHFPFKDNASPSR